MDERVPMRSKINWVGEDDVAIRIQPPIVGRRLSMDVSEAILAQVGARGLEHMVDQLAREIAYRHRDKIQSTVDSCLMDSSWAKPIIEEELRRSVRQFVSELFSGQ